MSAKNFNVGDKVRVRKDLVGGDRYGDYYFSKEMEKYLGQVFTIESMINNPFLAYKLNGIGYRWTDEMLEPIRRGGNKNMIGSLYIKDANFDEFSNPTPIQPLKIYTNETKKVVVVKWEDGTTTKATCSQDDHFDVTVGFAMCYVKKVYGGKKKLLNKVKKLSK